MSFVGLVNYSTAGNTHSVKKALEKAGAKVLLINETSDFSKVGKLVIPGVGSYKEAMEELNTNGFAECIRNFNGPILGICVGMQILSTLGYEHGVTKGLGIITGEVKNIQCEGKIPHVGFNKLIHRKVSRLFNGIENSLFYFMHSYEFVNYTDITTLTDYNNHMFVSSVERGDIFGVQFHPEKSRESGVQLFKNFLKI